MLNALQINPKNYTLSTFPSSNRRDSEDSGIVLAVSVSQFYQSSALTAQAYEMVITTVCVQIGIAAFIRESLFICVPH